MTFLNKVVVVTGGSKGIGKEIATTFATKKAIVHIIDIDEEELYKTGQMLNQQNLKIHTHLGDVANKAEVEKIFDSIFKLDHRIDILINNAGIVRDNSFHRMNEVDWEAVMNVHLKGAFHCSQQAQSYMVNQGWGRIINMSSISALGNKGQANYATAKAGIQGFTKTLAIELGKFGITVNAIAPGFIESDMTRLTAERLNITFDEFVQQSVKSIPVNRIGQPEDIANAVQFFADEKSSFINGQILYVSGGPNI